MNSLEQAQTNLAIRTHTRSDVRRITRSTTLTDVDCGKFLVLALDTDTVLTLPNASACVGGKIEGMVVTNYNSVSLTIVGYSSETGNAQLVGTYGEAALNKDGVQFGPHANVAVGFAFSLMSTGSRWCVCVSGARNTAAALTRVKYDRQSIPGFTNVRISWPVVPPSLPSTGLNICTCTDDNQRFSVTVDGFYLVSWCVEFGSTSADADLGTFLAVNDNTSTVLGKVTVPGSTRPETLSSSVVVPLMKNMFFSIIAFHTFSNTITVPNDQGLDEHYVMQITIVKLGVIA